MNVLTERHRTYLMSMVFVCVVTMAAGCAHVEKQASGTTEVKPQVKTLTTTEKHGYVTNAVEDLKITLAIDPKNKKVREELNRVIAKQDSEADGHYKAGIAVRDSNALEARKEFLNALRLRPNYEEAITALRDLQLATAEASIQARLKKEAAHAATPVKQKLSSDEEELDTQTYSLDIAIAAFEEGDYVKAIREFSKMKSRYPNDPDIQAYLDRSWYSNGVEQFNKKNYKKALDSFLKVPKNFDTVGEYIAKCRQALKSDATSKKPQKKK